jgi:CRP/FNR family transcriptional regulator, cyclic AMP receptor protein
MAANSSQAAGIDVLSRRGWLSQTPAAFQRAIIERCTLRPVARGQPVFVAGDDEADIFCIVRGHLDFLSRFSVSDGHVVHITHPGFWFGFAPLLTGTPRVFTVIARTDAVLAQVRAKHLSGLLKARPEWWHHMAVGIAEYANIAANAACDLMIPENERRVAAVLLRLCDCRFPPPSGGSPQEIPLTQAELAAMSNVSRNTLGTILRGLQDAGLISIGYGKIRPLQPERLRALVEAG